MPRRWARVLRVCAGVLALVVAPGVVGEMARAQSQQRETPIANAAAGADFVARSAIAPMTAGVSVVTNSVENRSNTPLAIDWERGGIYCAGRSQILPHETQKGANSGSQLINATAVPSDVKYGVLLQYPGLADVFIQPGTTPTSDHLESSFYRQRPDGAVAMRFAVTSDLEGGAASFSLEAPSNQIVAVPLALGALLRDNAQLAASGWRVIGTIDAAQIALADGTFGNIARQRLGTTGVLQIAPIAAGAGAAPKLSVRLSGSGWAPRRIFLAAYDPDRTGIVAFAVGVFVPVGRGGAAR